MFKITTLYQKINDLHAALPRRFGKGYALPPLRVGCVLSHRCNLRCSMCFVWKRGITGLDKRELSTLEWLGIIRQIPSFAIVTFTGGEPLIRPDIRELLAAASRSHRVHLVSNGTMFQPQMIEYCLSLAPRKIWDKGLLSLGISLEGPEAIHDAMVKIPGSFAKTIQALTDFATRKRQLGLKYPLLDIKIVICNETIGSLTELYEIADNIGADIISYQQCSTQESSYGIDDAPMDAMYTSPPPVDPIPEDVIKESIRKLVNRAAAGRTTLRFNPDMSADYFADRYQNRFPLDRFACSAAWSVMHIGPYGTVYPCFSIPMGNLREKSLMAIWNGPEYRAFRVKLQKHDIFKGCTGCCVMKPKASAKQ